MDNTWKIWFEIYEDNEKIGGGLWFQSYTRKGNAVRRARKQFDRIVTDQSGRVLSWRWVVCQENPWAKGVFDELCERDVPIAAY